MQIGMKVGHDEGVIRAARKVIMGIVTAPTGDNVKIAALDALTKLLNINGITVSDCTIVDDTTHNHYPKVEKEYDTNDVNNDE